MALLTDVRRFIGKKRKIKTVSLNGTQAERLADAPASKSDKSEQDLAMIEPKPIKSRDMQEDVVAMIRRIGEHLDAQSGRTERLIELMERLPPALEALPEINRQNTRLLDVLTDHLDQVRTREDALNATLSRLGEATSQQTETLTQVREELDRGTELSGRMTDTLGSFRETLTQLTETNTQSASVLTGMADTMHAREERMAQALTRTNRWMIAALAGCALVAGAAAVLAGIALL